MSSSELTYGMDDLEDEATPESHAGGNIGVILSSLVKMN
jgi:hypothetical protein